MSRKRRKRARRDKPSGRRRTLVVLAVVLALGVLTTAGVLLIRRSGGASAPAASPAAQGVSATGVDFRTLTGRWVRPDGGYILEIRDVDASGKIDAVYLNPQPINVAKAEATRDGSTLKVFVELRAPGYPGSTYTLTYDPKGDRFEGIYFQAALGQRFDVVFVRTQ